MFPDARTNDVPKLPVFALPVTLKTPDATKLAPDTLPDADNRVAPMLPKEALPVTLKVPVTE